MLANIIEYLADAFGPQLSYIDEDYGQLEALDSEQTDTYPITFPAVLVNTEGVEWSNTAELGQTGTASIRIRLVLDCYDDTHATAPMAKEKAAERQQFVHRLHCALQGFRPDDVGPMMRHRSASFTWRHGLKVYDLFYSYTTTEIIPGRETTVPPRIVVRAGGSLRNAL